MSTKITKQSKKLSKIFVLTLTVKQRLIHVFTMEMSSKPAKKNDTVKTSFNHFSKTWSLHILDIIDIGTKQNRGYRHILVAFENFIE